MEERGIGEVLGLGSSPTLPRSILPCDYPTRLYPNVSRPHTFSREEAVADDVTVPLHPTLLKAVPYNPILSHHTLPFPLLRHLAPTQPTLLYYNLHLTLPYPPLPNPMSPQPNIFYPFRTLTCPRLYPVISYSIPPYSALPHYTLPFLTPPHSTLPYPTIPNHTLPYPTYRTPPHPTLSVPTYPTLPYPIIPHSTLHYQVLPHPSIPYQP